MKNTLSFDFIVNKENNTVLVKREFDPNDRRKVFIVPNTEKITKLFEPFYKPFRKEMEELIASFSKKERDTIQAYLIKALEITDKTYNKFKQ